MADISYDINELEKAKKAISKLKTELDTCDAQLDNNLTSLKSDWKTNAGKKFFNEHKNNWSTFVKKYVKKLDGLEKMLNAVITQYNQINDEVGKINI
jgi:WXG100 family type VII secretion target